MKKLLQNSAERLRKDYTLQGSRLDIRTSTVLTFDAKKRAAYINALLDSLATEVEHDRLSLKDHIYFYEEMADLRRLLRSPPDQYVYVEDGKKRRWVLGKGAPGRTHIYWSLTQIWKMKTKQGDLAEQIKKKSPALVRRLDSLFDPNNKSKAGLRQKDMAIPCVLSFLQLDKGSSASFPPFHARFLAHKYLPKTGDCIVFDPCAGWGGRLIGSLLVNRKDKVTYIGVDPEKNNQAAYEGLKRRATIWLEKEIAGPRDAKVYCEAFEDFIKTRDAKRLLGKVDFAITSPPYWTAENYNPSDEKQSANRYPQYDQWVDGFLRPFIKGVFDLLKPGAHFALNIADVEGATLERDSRDLAFEAGFRWAGFYKLAMSISPAQRKDGTARHVVSVDGKLFKEEPVFLFRKPQIGEPVKATPAPARLRKRKTAPAPKIDPTTGLPDLGDWKDPYPAPRIEKVDNFFVVRDDLLEYGNKIRFLDYLVSRASEDEFVYGSSNKVGWGAISLAYLCKRYGKKAVCFIAKRNEPTWHQRKFMDLGGKIIWVPKGRLNITKSRAKDYAKSRPKTRRLMDIGFDDPTVLASIVKVARQLPYEPKEVWTVASSGTLTRGLQVAFPKARFFAVQTGHALKQEDAGRATIIRSELKYDRKVDEADLPPYPSEPYYDAKLWKFVKERASKGALIWNVA